MCVPERRIPVSGCCSLPLPNRTEDSGRATTGSPPGSARPSRSPAESRCPGFAPALPDWHRFQFRSGEPLHREADEQRPRRRRRRDPAPRIARGKPANSSAVGPRLPAEEKSLTSFDHMGARTTSLTCTDTGDTAFSRLEQCVRAPALVETITLSQIILLPGLV